MENKNNKRKALIYCRVSSDRQKNEGHGLDSQEHRCRQYAEQKEYLIDEVFKDSFTGGGDFHNRPELSRMLNYIDKHAHKLFVVIIDDLSRFARDVAAHFKLKKELLDRGVTLECSNFNFEDSPESELIETMMAAQHQYHRKNNKRQVVQKMKARMERGYWPFYQPPGYDFIKDSTHGKLLTPNRMAGVIKDAFEGFESGRFRTQTDVQNFLQEKNFCGRGKRVHLEKVNRLLTRSIYAGIIEYPQWEVTPRDGHHKAIISKETFYNVKRILTEGRRVRTRKDMRPDFPLRGLVTSVGSNKPYTASYSTGRNKKIPYYRDTDKKSPYYNKSISKKVLEDAIEKQFSDMLPTIEIVEFTEALIMDEWNKRNQNKGAEEHEIRLELARIEKEKEKLTERILATESDAVIRTYENKLDGLSNKENELNKKLGNVRSPLDFGTAFGRVMEYVKNPVKQWQSDDLERKRAVVQVVFDGLASYQSDVGFGTAKLAPIYSILEEISVSKSQGVEMAGIEPTCKQSKHMILQSLVYLFDSIARLEDKQNIKQSKSFVSK